MNITHGAYRKNACTVSLTWLCIYPTQHTYIYTCTIWFCDVCRGYLRMRYLYEWGTDSRYFGFITISIYLVGKTVEIIWYVGNYTCLFYRIFLLVCLLADCFVVHFLHSCEIVNDVRKNSMRELLWIFWKKINNVSLGRDLVYVFKLLNLTWKAGEIFERITMSLILDVSCLILPIYT